MVYEIRNYHFDPDLFDEYKAWARERALPHLRTVMDVVGFWVATGADPDVMGAPQDELGSANVTWIVRWDDAAACKKTWDEVLASEAWQEVFSHVPGGIGSYRRIESKLADAL